MRLIALVCLVMIAFAGNSVLTRIALVGDMIGALPFAAIRLASGAAALAALVLLQRRPLPVAGPGRLSGALSLSLYVIAFSLAYLGLDAGVGALILFGAVQVTMFLGAVLERQEIPPASWTGAALAFAGLIWLLWPVGAAAPSPLHALLMALAGAGWGIYSLVGRRAGPPLSATAANFVAATPLVLAVALLQGGGAAPTAAGVSLAVLSGVVTSGLGYALWYAVLPAIAASTAALAQLSVPVIAMLGGMLLLGETPTLRFVLASLLVLGGIAYGIRARKT